MSELPFEQMYPDVLGAISGGVRVNMDQLQCVLGMFPRQAYINQPIEAVLILQNMVDQPMQVKVSIRLPGQDRKGRTMVLSGPTQVNTVDLGPGEVGTLRLPIVALPPTAPETDVPMHVEVRFRTARPGQYVRPPAGGVPPASLNMSPFKLQALRDVEYFSRPWNDSTDIITGTFDIAPKRLPPPQQDMTARFETVWTPREMEREHQLADSTLDTARQIARDMTSTEVYPPLLFATEQKFMARGMPLESGEMKAIAKLLTYTLADASVMDRAFEVEQSRWFRTLCHALAHDANVSTWDGGDIAARYLYEAALHDSVLLGFRLVQPRVRENMGTREERQAYANELLAWFGGRGQPSLNYVYLPLVMGGIAVNQVVGMSHENPWIMVDQLRDSAERRVRLVQGEATEIFTLVDRLLERAEDELVRSHVEQP